MARAVGIRCLQSFFLLEYDAARLGMASEDALISCILSASIWDPIPLLGRTHPPHFIQLPANTDLFPLASHLLSVCTVPQTTRIVPVEP
jgi:hypothetical protein